MNLNKLLAWLWKFKNRFFLIKKTSFGFRTIQAVGYLRSVFNHFVILLLKKLKLRIVASVISMLVYYLADAQIQRVLDSKQIKDRSL